MNSQISELLERAAVDTPSLKQVWREWRFWQELFIYFWVFSLAGHYLEVGWAFFIHIVTGHPLWHPITSLFIPLSVPYGLGTVAVILLTWPLVEKHKFNPIIIFILNVIITSIIEYFCALMVVNFAGHNQFWDYSNRFMNINGYVCIESSLLFGVASTLFIYYIYPFCEKFLQRVKNRQLNIIFWTLLTCYAVDLVYSNFLK